MIEICIILWLLIGFWGWTHAYKYMKNDIIDRLEVFYGLTVMTMMGPTVFFLNFLVGVYDKKDKKDKKTE